MSGISKAVGAPSMADMAVLFAQVAQQDMKTNDELRDAAFAGEIALRESALRDEREAATKRLVGGLANNIGSIASGGFQVSAGTTKDESLARERMGKGAVLDNVLKAGGTVAQWGADTSMISAKEKGIAADKLRYHRDNLSETKQESKRLRDSFVSMMKQAIDDEKRSAERILRG